MSKTKHISESIQPEVDEYNKSKPKVYKWDIVWINVFLLGGLHVLALYGLYIRYFGYMKLQTITCTKIVGLTAAIGTTAGAHRLWSHKSYKANMPLQIILAAMMTLSYQNSIYIWCRDHRLHHKYSETDADPHNAKRGLFFSHVGWLLVRKHKDVIEKGKYTDMSDLEANPVVKFQHKYYHILVSLWGFIMPTFVTWYFYNEFLWYAFLASTVAYTMAINIIWCINSLAHYSGNRPYDSKIGPAENGIMQYIGLGEGFHNYHHTFPWDYKLSEYGFDCRTLTTGFIDLFAKIGWVTDRREAPKLMIENQSTLNGDGTWTRNPIINNIKSVLYFGLFVIFIF